MRWIYDIYKHLKVLVNPFCAVLVVFSLNVNAESQSKFTYLSTFERATIVLIFKTALKESTQGPFLNQTQPEISSNLIKNKIQTLTTNSLNQPVKNVEVSSFDEFIELETQQKFFSEHKLSELTDAQITELSQQVYLSAKDEFLQNKIISYQNKKTQVSQDLASQLIAYLQQTQLFEFTTNNNYLQESTAHKTEHTQKKLLQFFDDKINEITAALTAQSTAAEVAVLAKLLKLYFKALPLSQKLEILYQISLQPLESKPLDIFLVMIQNTGPQMQKLIQIMGRSPKIPQEFKIVFQKLESQVTPVPWWKVQKTLKEQNFNFLDYHYFEKKPLGVGTMAQTHRAQKYENGERKSLVIRFLKPQIAELLEMDHQILSRVALDIDQDSELQKYNLPSLADLIDDLNASVQEELVVAKTVEAQKKAQLSYNREEVISFNQQKNILEIKVPQVELASESSDIMVQELVFGRKPFKEFKEYQDLYPDLYRVSAEKVAEIWLETAFFTSGFFHADLHQGNILAAYTDEKIRINILDYGMTGQLNSQLQKSALLFALGIRLKRPDLMAKHLWLLSKNSQGHSIKTKNSIMLTETLLLDLIHQQVSKNLALNQDMGIDTWTAWALDQGLELNYEFLKLNRGLKAIEILLADANSKATFADLAHRALLRNKQHITRLLITEPLIKPTDYMKLGLDFIASKSEKSKPALKCEMLF